jgi:hypothetical protein
MKTQMTKDLEKFLAFMLLVCLSLFTVCSAAMAYEFCYNLNENMLGGLIPYIVMGFGAPAGAGGMWLYKATVD